MRVLLFLSFLTAGSVYADSDYTEIRQLELDADRVRLLDVEAGAGTLTVTGDERSDSIRVTAEIEVPNHDDDEAVRLIEKRLELDLSRDGDRAVLIADFDTGGWRFGDAPRVHLTIEMPDTLDLIVEDGSGSMVIRGVHGNIDVDDGSGSMRLEDVGGDVRIEDGSGSLAVSDAGGNVRIRDGSGSIRVHRVVGSVTVDDGSGSISVHDVDEDLIILDDGTGSVSYTGIEGRVENDT